MTTIPPYLSLDTSYTTQEIQDEIPKSASKAESAIEAFDILI
jgi:hypothetical protein